MTSLLPLERDLTIAYVVSLAIALLVAVMSAAGLMLDPTSLYGVEPTLIQVSRGGDVANLIIGLPLLLGSMWRARRGSLLGLLLWPGALFFVLYAYSLYLLGTSFNVLFFGYVAVVTLSAYTVMFLVASIDAEAVRQRLSGARAKLVGGALVVIAVLAYIGLTATVVGALSNPQSEAGMRPQWIVDFTVGTPVLLIGGALLWRRVALGYVAAGGLLLVSGLNGLAFSLSAVLVGLAPDSATDPTVVMVHLAIAAVSFAFLAMFLRSISSTGRSGLGPGEGPTDRSHGLTWNREE